MTTSTYTQASRRMAVETPLGKDVLVLTSFSGTEEMSRLFSYSVSMISTRDSIDPKQIVGKRVTFWVEHEDGSPRYFDGFVSRFAYLGTDDRVSRYYAEVVPWLWFLTKTADCRIFQQKNVKDIIQQIFSDLGWSDFENSEVKGSHPPWEYCVQYRETDFNFVSRLMEQEGIFYFFRHEKGKHTLVLADSKGAYKDLKDKDARLSSSMSEPDLSDNITKWQHQYEYRSGKWAHTDYNFETPSTSLMSKIDSVIKLENNSKYEVYDFPGEYEKKDQGDGEVRIHMEEEEAGYEIIHGGSYCRSFNPGGKFKMNKHYVKAEEGKGYVVTAVRHNGTVGETYLTGGQAEGRYWNTFVCIPDSVVYRPPRVTTKPMIHGVQTAVVVGPKGEEIYTDKYGRVKVQFYWDREGKKDDKSSCWIRVAQPFAGRNWGVTVWPRIGQEVVVEFLEGDPDRPLIVGTVYNADQMPPYVLPDNQTRSTMKSCSSKGGEGFNEIRFEDKKGKEQIFIHAERNMDVRTKNDSMERVIANRHLIVGSEKDGSKNGDQKEMVYRDKFLKIHRNQSEQVGGSMQLLVGGIDGGSGNQDILVKGDKKETIEKNSHVHVKSDRNEKIDGNQSLTVGGSYQEKAGMKHAVEASQEIHLKSGMKVILEAGIQLTIKGPGGFVDIGPAGVTIQGTMVLINSGGAAGAGSGSSPTAPQDAQQANPTEPAEADDDKSGKPSN